MKLYSDMYDFHFMFKDRQFGVNLVDTKSGKNRFFPLPNESYAENVTQHMNSLTDIQMKDFLK